MKLTEKVKSIKASQKAWGINWDKINEGGYYAGNVPPVAAESIGQAKVLLWPDIQDYILSDGSHMEFITMPIKRFPQSDLFEFEGGLHTEWQIEELKTERERKRKLSSILEDSDISHCYIIKRGLYYGDNMCGYTDYRSKAGVYTKSDAVSHAMSCHEVSVRVIDKEDHNNLILEQIKALRSRII